MHITGSYFLNTMAWRDLDLYVDSTDMADEDFFRMGHAVDAVLRPGKMHYRNEFVLRSGLPLGRYWGIYTNPSSADGWKIDLWAICSDLCDEHMAFAGRLKARIGEDARLRILEIKSAVWQHPQYRRDFTSMDIYSAVLDGGVEGVGDFERWLMAGKGLEISL